MMADFSRFMKAMARVKPEKPKAKMKVRKGNSKT